MPCTQYAPLHFTESDDNQLNRKRSRKAAHRLHDTVNRGTVQSIRADSRYFTNQASIDFHCLISSPFCLKILANPARSQSVYSFIWKTALTIFIGRRCTDREWDCQPANLYESIDSPSFSETALSSKEKPQVQRLSLQLPKRILSKGETLCLKTAMIS